MFTSVYYLIESYFYYRVFLSIVTLILLCVAVNLVCPKGQTILTPPGNTKVNWQEPKLTGWDNTNFTSSSVSGDTFAVGSHSVTYEQWFDINNLLLTCSFDVVIKGKQYGTCSFHL